VVALELQAESVVAHLLLAMTLFAVVLALLVRQIWDPVDAASPAHSASAAATPAGPKSAPSSATIAATRPPKLSFRWTTTAARRRLAAWTARP